MASTLSDLVGEIDLLLQVACDKWGRRVPIGAADGSLSDNNGQTSILACASYDVNDPMVHYSKILYL